MKYTGDRLRRQEKVNWGNFQDWIKSKMERDIFFYIGECRIVNIKYMWFTEVCGKGMWKDNHEECWGHLTGVFIWKSGEEVVLAF